MKVILYILILIAFLSNCNIINAKVDSLVCKEFWLPINLEWEFAYDDVKYNEGPLIFECIDSTFNIIYPGSLTIHNDTIKVNQEMGYPNKCIKLGKIKVGDIKNLKIKDKISIFKRVNNTKIEFNGIQFEKIENTVLYCTSCDW